MHIFINPKMLPIIRNKIIFPTFLLFSFFMLLILICLFNNLISWTIKRYSQRYTNVQSNQFHLIKLFFIISLYHEVINKKKSFENYWVVGEDLLFDILSTYLKILNEGKLLYLLLSFHGNLINSKFCSRKFSFFHFEYYLSI